MTALIEAEDESAAARLLQHLGMREVRDVRVLSGGVSNRVFRAVTSSGDIVMKQSLGKLMVRDDWHAPRERISAEAEAMRLYHSLGPAQSPALVAFDPDQFALVMTAAPTGWEDWKSRLLRGKDDERLARRLGEHLANLHQAAHGVALSPVLDDPSRFAQLRLEPYFFTAANRQPANSDALYAVVEAIRVRRETLVHGDFSPKNILTDGAAFWVTDFEVAHFGDPTVDVGFGLTHLMLKSIAFPSHADTLTRTAKAYLSGYDDVLAIRGDPHLAAVTAALFAARVDGRSPVDYLDADQTAYVRILATRWLANPDVFWENWEDR